MSEERTLILQMLKDGSISVEEAERLLEAIEKDAAETDPASETVYLGGQMPTRLHIYASENDRTKANIRIPFSLVRVGLKLGKSFGAIGLKHSEDDAERVALEALQDLDIDELLCSIMDGTISLPYTLIEASDDEKNEHVKIVLE